MFKYTAVKGYKSMGEIGLMSHIYQMVELDKETPMVILTNAYVERQKVFKGYLMIGEGTFTCVALTAEEKTQIEAVIGKFEEVAFNEFVKSTGLGSRYSSFTEVKKTEAAKDE